MSVLTHIPGVFYNVTTDRYTEGDLVCSDCLPMTNVEGKVAILCRPADQRCVQCDKPTTECAHEAVAEHTGYPINRAGACPVVAVCEDCGEELGQVGWDSVL